MSDQKIIAEYKNLEISVVRQIPYTEDEKEKIQIIKHFPECIPSICVLNLKSLNNKSSKLVHSEVVAKLKPYFVPDEDVRGFDNGFVGLPDDLLKELLEHLKHADGNSLNH